MMSKVTQYYHELVSSLSKWLRHEECDIDALVTQVREKIARVGNLTQSETELVIAIVRHDFEEFVRSYEESHEDESNSVFMRVIKGSLWQELADITNKTQLEWREAFQDLNHHDVYHSGGVVGLGSSVYEKRHYYLAVHTPDALPCCPKCGHNQFQRRSFGP